MPPRGRAHEHVAAGRRTWLRKRSSIRTLMKYSLPVFGSVKGMGANCVLPSRLVSTVCATSCSRDAEHARLLAVDDDVELGVVLFAPDLHVGEQRLALDRR